MVNRSAAKSLANTPQGPEVKKKATPSSSAKKLKQTRLSFVTKDNVVGTADGLRKRKLSSPETECDRTVKVVRREKEVDDPVVLSDDDEVAGDSSKQKEGDQEMIEIISCEVDEASNSCVETVEEVDDNDDLIEEVLPSESENTNDAREGDPLNESALVDDNSSAGSGSDDADKTVQDTSLTNVLEPPSSANGKPLTPRQLEKFMEKKKRHEERLRQKLERERKLEEEKRQREEKERLKKKEREEKEEQKRKEREEKEAARLREKEEKETARLREKEEKELAKQKEKEEKERKRQMELEQKRRKEELKEEERRKKEDEKRAKELEEELKRKKAAQAFTKFFKVGNADDKINGSGTGSAAGQQPPAEEEVVEVSNQYFMPFEVKGDMKLAPTVRRVFNSKAKGALDKVLQGESPTASTTPELYLKSLKTKSHVPLKGSKTWIVSDSSDDDSEDELMVVDEEVAHKVEEIRKPKEKYRAKCLMFRENRRPAYYGTWQKKSLAVGPRRPFAKDEKFFDYEVDSDDEWEEEEPGESLHGSDDEKDKESEDDYEVDNDFFVPHGFLSDEEMQNADDPEDNSPEAQKVKLKLLQDEFNDEMKKKTEKIKPRLIGCIWVSEKGGKPDNCPAIFWELLQFRSVLSAGPIELRPPASAEVLGNADEDADAEDNDAEKGNRKKAQSLPEGEVCELIRLVHGNLNSGKFLVKEFQKYRESQPNSTDSSLRVVTNLSILRKIKELAKWEAPCWVVQKDVLEQHQLSELPLINKWEYALTPKRTHEMLKSAQEKKQAPASPQVAPMEFQPTPVTAVEAPKTPKTAATHEKASPPTSAKQKSNPNSIARFTKVLTTEEKQKQFQLIKIASPKQTPVVATTARNENKAPVVNSTEKVETITKPATKLVLCHSIYCSGWSRYTKHEITVRLFFN